MDLALATVVFVGPYTWGLGQAKVRSASITPATGPYPRLLQSWDLTSVIYFGGLVKAISKLVIGTPTIKVWPKAVSTSS